MDPRLATLQREIASAVSGLSPEDLVRAIPGKWCAAEILEHLYLTYTGTLKGFGRVLEQGHCLASNSTWSQRGKAFIVVNLGYMPTGRKSPAVALPRGIPPAKIVNDVSSTLTELDEVMKQCAARFGASTKILDHPILGPLSINEWRKFHLVHGKHHLEQIARLRQQLGNE
jgi:Protein of unknown function (DUF1569)